MLSSYTPTATEGLIYRSLEVDDLLVSLSVKIIDESTPK